VDESLSRRGFRIFRRCYRAFYRIKNDGGWRIAPISPGLSYLTSLRLVVVWLEVDEAFVREKSGQRRATSVGVHTGIE